MHKAEQENCIIHPRASSVKQAEGETLEDQEKLGRILASSNNWKVVAVFGWIHSGRKTEREDMEEVIAYIKKSEVKISHYITKGIDRFTRLGGTEYMRFKSELEKLGMQVWDTEGIIQQKRNYLSDLVDDVYDWAYYSPSESAEMARAQDAKDDGRRIITRLVRAEIKLVQAGYLTRRPTDGYILEDVYFDDGKKKKIGKPDPIRVKYFIDMFNLRARGNLSDKDIVSSINASGYKSKIMKRYGKERGLKKLIGHIGGKSLTVKQLQRIIQKPIYAGVICEKWTKNLPVKAQFDGLISVETFNLANRGKVYIKENEDGTLRILRDYEKFASTKPKRLRNNPDYRYRFFPCFICRKWMLGSASRSKSGKHPPRYHCGNLPARKHDYYSIPKEEYEGAIKKYVGALKFTDVMITGFETVLNDVYRTREKEIVTQSSMISHNVGNLKAQQASALDTLTVTQSPVVRKKLEEQIDELERQIQEAECQRNEIEVTEKDIKAFVKYVKFVMEHPSEILIDTDDMQAQQTLFGLVFEKLPTYQEILNGTPKLSLAFKLSEEWDKSKSQLVTLTMRNSKPIIQFLQELSSVAGKFASLQKRGLLQAAQFQGVID